MDRDREREHQRARFHKRQFDNPFHNWSLIVHASISRARPTLWPPLVTFAQSMLNDRVNMTFSSSFCCRLKPNWRSVLNLQRNVDPSSILHFAAAPSVHSCTPPFLARTPLIAASQSGFTWKIAKRIQLSPLRHSFKTVLFDSFFFFPSRSVASLSIFRSLFLFAVVEPRNSRNTRKIVGTFKVEFLSICNYEIDKNFTESSFHILRDSSVINFSVLCYVKFLYFFYFFFVTLFILTFLMEICW